MTKEEFIEELHKLGINVTNKELDMLEIYLNFLKEYNSHTNITRIVEENEVYLKHFYDSLTITKAIDLDEIDTLLDVGSGAGFPGMVLKIFYPHLQVTLLDSNNKKTKFLTELKSKLNLDVEVINERVEDYAKNNLNKFTLVTSRAVANLRVLSEISLPLVKKEGYFIPLKGSIDPELVEAKKTISLMNSKIEDIISFNLYKESGIRNIIRIKKEEETKLEMLRPYNKILRKPLAKKC